MANPKIQPFVFPVSGINEVVPNSAYPQDAAPDALNVRPFDALESRARGGQRQGMLDFFSSTTGSGGPVQRIDSIVQPASAAGSPSFGSFYDQPSFTFAEEIRMMAWHPDGDVLFVAENTGGGERVRAFNFTLAGGWGSEIDSVVAGRAVSNVDDPGFLAVHPTGGAVLVSNVNVGFQVVPFDKDSGFGTVVDSGVDAEFGEFHPSGDYIIVTVDGSPYLAAYPYDVSANSVGSKLANPSTLPGRQPDGVAVSPNGDYVALTDAETTNGDDLWIYAFDADAGSWGARTATFEDSDDSPIDVLPLWTPDQQWVGAALGDQGFYLLPFNSSDGSLGAGSEQIKTPTPETVGTGFEVSNWLNAAFSPDGQFLIAFAESNLLPNRIVLWQFQGGEFSTPLVKDSEDNSVSYWGWIAWHPTGRAVGLGGTEEGDSSNDNDVSVISFGGGLTAFSERVHRLVVVAGGNVYVSGQFLSALNQPTSGSGAFQSDLVNAPDSTVAFQDMFFCDGKASNYQYYDLDDDEVKDWSANLSAGSLPVGTVDSTDACTICVTYRGRVVMAGLSEDPQNWFMSKSGDPFDWNFSPGTTTAIQAVAGNNSDAGKLEDFITALMPWRDDILFMGGDKTVWALQGDPAAGGRIDNVSRHVGVVGQYAYCFDTAGMLYFFGQNGLYRVAPGGGEVQHVSRGRLDRTFRNIDLVDNEIHMVYDRDFQGVHIFVLPKSQSSDAGDHWFYDERTDSFWRDQFPASIGPSTVHLFDGAAARDRAVMMGGFDDRVYVLDPAAKDDAGAAIESYIRFSPVNAGGVFGRTRMKNMKIVTDRESSSTTLNVYRGETPEQAVEAADLAFSRANMAGRTTSIRQRVVGNSLMIELKNDAVDERWAFESGAIVIETAGPQRRPDR